MKPRISRLIAITFICVLLGLALSWQLQSIQKNEKLNVFERQKKHDLVIKLLNEQKLNEDYQIKISTLQGTVDKYEKNLGNSDENLKLLTEQIQNLKIAAGLTNVQGNGVILTFNKDLTLKVKDDDLLFVLNVLRVANAQALAINDQRIINTTEVRVAGGYIMVNGRHVTPPYVIKAIGDTNQFNKFLNESGITDETTYFGKRISVTQKEIVIPKFSNDINGLISKLEVIDNEAKNK